MLTCQLHANTVVGAQAKGHVCQAPTPVAPGLVTQPPVWLKGFGILPPPLVMVNAPHVDLHQGVSGYEVCPQLQ